MHLTWLSTNTCVRTTLRKPAAPQTPQDQGIDPLCPGCCLSGPLPCGGLQAAIPMLLTNPVPLPLMRRPGSEAEPTAIPAASAQKPGMLPSLKIFVPLGPTTLPSPNCCLWKELHVNTVLLKQNSYSPILLYLCWANRALPGALSISQN